MKTTRIISLLLVAVFMCLCFASCGSKVKADVHVMFVDGDGNTIGDVNVTVTGTKSNPPTVLRAAEEALIYLDYEKGYELTADGNSIKAVNGIVEVDETDETNGYYSYWRVYINGQDSSSGRQSVTSVYSQDEVVYKYVSDSQPRRDVVADTAAAE